MSEATILNCSPILFRKITIPSITYCFQRTTYFIPKIHNSEEMTAVRSGSIYTVCASFMKRQTGDYLEGSFNSAEMIFHQGLLIIKVPQLPRTSTSEFDPI
jgi:hypothetical protein